VYRPAQAAVHRRVSRDRPPEGLQSRPRGALSWYPDPPESRRLRS
jgi:hypothetical protein